jgi:hypothetical protein
VRFFDCQHIVRFLDDTNQGLVTLGIGANAARVRFCNVRTDGTIPDFILHVDESFRQRDDFIPAHFENVQRKAMGRFAPNARELRELFCEVFD